MKAEAGVQAAESMALNDLLNGFDRTETGLTAQRRVPGSVRGGLRAVGDQDRGLDDILGQFEGAWDLMLVHCLSAIRLRARILGESYKQEARSQDRR